MSDIEVSREELRFVSQDLIEKRLRINEGHANEIINQFEYAELSGKRTHGFARIPWLLDLRLKGHQPLDLASPESILHVDATRSIGYLAAQEIATHLKSTSEVSPFKLVVARDIFPTNVLGYYVRSMLENENRFGFIFGTTPNLVIGPGMDSKSIGTNPVAVGLMHNGVEAVADITTASASLGELIQAKYWGGFTPDKFQTVDGSVPLEVGDLYEDGSFTGAIVQKIDTKAEGRLYALNLMTQLLTGVIAQQADNRGNLIFGSVATSFVTGSERLSEDLPFAIQSHLLPGARSHERYMIAKEKPTVTLPESLWREILGRSQK